MRYVTSKSPVAGKHKKLGEFSIVVEVPQVESDDEADTFFGGKDKKVAFLNRAIETASKNGVRAAARGLDETATTKDDLIADESETSEKGKEYRRLRKLARDYTPSSGQERGISAKKGKEIATNLQQIVADPTKESFTREELMALLAAAK